MPASANSGWFVAGRCPAAARCSRPRPGRGRAAAARRRRRTAPCRAGTASPRSRPICANVVLHDSTKLSSSVPPHVSSPKFASAMRRSAGAASSVSCGNSVSGVGDAVVERDRRGHHLERRARRVALAVRARQVGLRRVVAERREVAPAPPSASWLASGCGSNVGFEYIARISPVVTSSATTEPRWPPSACGRGALHVGAQREHDGADGLLAADDVGEVLDLQLGVAPDELVVVALLDAGVADDERLVADDLANSAPRAGTRAGT